ncbi:ECF RNA polymerase sigma factor SigW [Polycladomyces abyssicola]|uniref:RNA polymerase sigma factor n=1 Tax=Polycladomyces abyssicola TaxID=1125966 RepID=A0A8D5UIH4_9BACL|nr:RNA polymerase sigma factor [Polycladomyces abyssicola]BCU82824.1 ECF RNA polymerase sigma factor SigW [Polycladomyces abyssicola]
MDQELYDLITRAKQGDKRAFESLVNRYKRNVYYQAYGMLNDVMEAEDVLQEAFIKAYFSLKELDSIYAFTSWLSRIVYHLCYDRLQKRKKVKTIVIDWLDKRNKQPIDSDSLIEQKQLQIDLHQAMQSLSSEHRAVLLLREIQGLSYKEIAKIMRVPEGTVKSRIHAARLALRNALKKRGDQDGAY